MSAPLSIALVTPSYQQGAYLEAALRSVLDQRYPALEYVVQDGGSNDETCSILERYSSQLTHWTSAPDGGQYAAVAAGFARTRGEVLGWLNSDDMLCPWALSVVAEIFARFPEVEWLTSARPLIWDRAGRAVACPALPGFARRAFAQGEHLPRASHFALGYIQQESTFWRRSLWERAGGFDPAFPLAGDCALWARFFQHAELHAVEVPLGGFRVHGDQKTSRQAVLYAEEAERALQTYGGRRSSKLAEMRREVARRFPARLWPALAHAGWMHQAPMITYDRAGEWRQERRFI